MRVLMDMDDEDYNDDIPLPDVPWERLTFEDLLPSSRELDKLDEEEARILDGFDGP